MVRFAQHNFNYQRIQTEVMGMYLGFRQILGNRVQIEVLVGWMPEWTKSIMKTIIDVAVNGNRSFFVPRSSVPNVDFADIDTLLGILEVTREFDLPLVSFFPKGVASGKNYINSGPSEWGKDRLN